MTRRDRQRKQQSRQAHANREDERTVVMVPSRSRPPLCTSKRLRGKVKLTKTEQFRKRNKR